jgi:ATP-dependent RNA helicase HelY
VNSDTSVEEQPRDASLSQVSEFASNYPFELDDYQIRACEIVAEGRGVLVAAPTGAGKTVVGEFAVWQALNSGTKCFYTTPIKALSNQKYHDLVARHGVDAVGLLTGDQSVNSEAPIIVMTTEVLRNMIYASSQTLLGLGYAVLDEVHYLADRERGAVWEEVVLGLADSVQIVALSATVSNAEEFGAWLDEARGGVDIVVSETRPVPLRQHVLVGRDLVGLFDTSKEGQRRRKPNPKLMRIAAEENRELAARRDDDEGFRSRRGYRGRGGDRGYRGHGRRSLDAAGSPRPKLVPTRAGAVRALAASDMLPAIYFIFSRAGCDKAVLQLAKRNLVLTSAFEQKQLRAIADRYGESLSAADRRAIRWDEFTHNLSMGYAAHHAGLLPVCKAVVEEAFTSGALKVVFATETLALGVNMPARSVVIEKLTKYNGTDHQELTPGEYTQLTGRAGRRGKDSVGHAVVEWAAGLDPKRLASLAGSRTFALNSSFQPSYNMAVNLIGAMGVQRAENLLLGSFAQFQATAGSNRRRRGTSLVEQFGQIRGVLGELGYLDADENVTDLGRTLARVYNELDLVLVEAVRAGVLDGLGPVRLAAVLSSLVYESRGGRESWGRNSRNGVLWPDGPSERGYRRLLKIYRRITRLEHEYGIETDRQLDEGFAQAAFAWADGETLAQVLSDTNLAPGDLVRWIRQVIDLGQQLVRAPGIPEDLVAAAKEMVQSMRRDIVDLDAD